MRALFLVPVAVLGLVAASPSVSVAETPRPEIAKRGGGACKGNKVAVKVGGRKVCRPFGQVFPRPRAIDLRLAYLRQALRVDPAKLASGKKGKRVRTLQSGFGAAGKRAQKEVLHLLPRALAFFDRKRDGARGSALRRDATASANCGVGAAGARGTLGGSSTVGMLGNNGLFIETDGGGLRIRVTFFSCGGVNSFRIPECPTGDGDVVAQTATGDFSATTEVWRGSELVSRNSTRFEDSSKARGKVGKDAKLKHIEVEHEQEVLIVASGGVVVRGGVKRDVKIDMPGGNYDPARAKVKFKGERIGENLGAEGFSRSVAAAIDGYKGAEPRWSSFDRRPLCAKAVFTPPSDTLKLKRGQTGQVSVHAKAQDGGTAKEAKWNLLNQVGADLTPAASEAANATFSYTVKQTPGAFVEVTVKFTSTAGVGEDRWRQPLDALLPSRFTITFSGSASYDSSEVGGGGGQAHWSGNADLREMPNPYPPGTFPHELAMYQLASGSITYSYSGSLGSCSATASGPIDLAKQPDVANGVVLTIFDKTPREYSILLGMPLTDKATVSGLLGPCEDPEDEGGIDFFPGIGVPMLVNAPFPGGPVSEDWSISGSGSKGLPGSPDQSWQWNLVPSFGP